MNFITYFEPPYLLNYNYIVVPLPTGFFVSAYFNGEGVQEFFTTNGTKKWTIRQRGCCVGHLYFVSLSAGERYFLHTLLMKVKGVISFEVLHTVNGVVRDTFKSTRIAHGLYDSDDEWNACLEEVVGMQIGAQLRSLFVTILAFGIPSELRMFWDKYKEHICDDYKAALQCRDIVEPSIKQIKSWALHSL